MPDFDKEMAARVWQRVSSHSAAGDPVAQLHSLITEELHDAALYLHLSRQFKGSENALLRKLHQQELSHAACLKGLYTLLTGKRPALRAAPVKPAPVETLLRQCYGREMHCLALYEAKKDDPEYGQLFVHLADQERTHCHAILQLFGNLKV